METTRTYMEASLCSLYIHFGDVPGHMVAAVCVRRSGKLLSILFYIQTILLSVVSLYFYL